jgi:putative transposase
MVSLGPNEPSDDARADVFDCIERFYNPPRRHSTIGYKIPMACGTKLRLSLQHLS